MLLKEYLDSVFEVITIPTDKESIAKIFADALTYPKIHTTERIEKKLHFKYFLNYLFQDPDGLNIKTIVIEKNYTSASYLDDYFNYYSKCYFPYLKQCRRVHFFDKVIEKEVFLKLLSTNSNTEYWNSYKGHLVIKPLPKGIIGASLIAPYKNKNKRFFTAINEYNVNIFGKELKISSMPYQEQDSIVGSCASASLWFAFHKTSHLFNTDTPSPSIITLSAGNDSNYTGKTFPSDSLETTQICKAITANGLVSEVIDSTDYLLNNKWLKAFVYAYSRMGIPVLLGIDTENIGSHLITINGYRLGNMKGDLDKSLIEIKLASDNICKFYAHDDQSGPYSRLEVLGEGSKYQFETSLWKSHDSEETLLANTTLVIIPHPESIRVTFENILEEVTVIAFDITTRLNLNFEWDIFLIESNKYKSDIRNKIIKSPDAYDVSSIKLQFKSLPKYIWVAQAKTIIDGDNFLIFDLIYDAIDVNYANSPYYINIYNEDFRTKAKEFDIFSSRVFEIDYSGTNGSYSESARVLNEDTRFIEMIESISEEFNQPYSTEKILALLKQLNETELSKLRDSATASIKILSAIISGN